MDRIKVERDSRFVTGRKILWIPVHGLPCDGCNDLIMAIGAILDHVYTFLGDMYKRISCKG